MIKMLYMTANGQDLSTYREVDGHSVWTDSPSPSERLNGHTYTAREIAESTTSRTGFYGYHQPEGE